MLKSLNVFIVSLVIASAAVLLAGCSTTKPVASSSVSVSTAAADSSAYKKRVAIYDVLRRNYVTVFQVGDEITMALPIDKFFHADTARINNSYYPALNAIAEFLSAYNIVDIKVAGYSDNQGNLSHSLALTNQQTQKIVKYLWRQHIDARLLYARGYGTQDPISSNKTYRGRAQNRRIMITFRRYTV